MDDKKVVEGNTRGRTVQALPKETQVHWADDTSKELQLNRETVHYIPTLH